MKNHIAKTLTVLLMAAIACLPLSATAQQTSAVPQSTQTAQSAKPSPSAAPSAQEDQPDVTPQPDATASENETAQENVLDQDAAQAALADESVLESDITSYVSLKRGDQSDAVRALQQRLSDLGYMPGPVDGIFGWGTYDSVRRFQLTLDLSQTGTADEALQQKLFAEDAPAFNRYVSVRKGQNTVRVKDMQQRLKDLGYPYVKVTGSFDGSTLKAVHLFQWDNGYEESSTMSSAQLQKLYGSAKSYTRYAALSKGDKGLRVELMQQRLKKLGYYDGKANGRYNQATKEAVSDFQTAAGLKATGKANAKTLRKLYGKKAPVKDDPVVPTPTPQPVPTPTPQPQ